MIFSGDIHYIVALGMEENAGSKSELAALHSLVEMRVEIIYILVSSFH